MEKIKVENIKKTYGGIRAIEEINISVTSNQFISILGPSGCGKSTLLNIISGIETPDSGRVLIDGKNFIGKTGRVSYMQQKDLLLPWKNILDNVSISLVIKGMSWKEARKKAQQHFKPFGLEGFEGKYPDQLSGGMRKRAALLRTYLFTSDIMMLDEPFASLDAITRRKMHVWLMDIYKNYKPTVLFITHDIDEAIFLSDAVYILSPRPASVKTKLDINIPRPRNIKSFSNPDYIKLKERILKLL